MRLHCQIAALCVLLLGCGRQTAEPVAMPEFTLAEAADSIPLAFQRDVRVGDVILVLQDVVADSRCPRDVTCVWEGDALVSLAVHPACLPQGCRAASAELRLHTNVEPREGDALAHRIRLLHLLPEPLRGTPADSSRYVAWVRVTR